MAPGAEHDGWVRQTQPVPVVSVEVLDQLADVFVALACHHEADREAGRVGSWRDELEASEGAEGPFALQVHVQDDA